MGQALSYVLRCICGEAEDNQERTREQYLSLALPCKQSTSDALLQTLLTSSPSSDSYDDSSPSSTLVCSSSVDLHGDSGTNGALCQNFLIFQRGLGSHSDSSTTWALQQEVPTSSPSSDSYDDTSPSGAFVCSSSVDLHGDTSTNGALYQNIMVVQQGLDSHSNSSTTWALQQEVLTSSPSSDSYDDSSPGGTFVCLSSVDLHGDTSTNGALCQNIMVVQQGLDSHGNSSTTWALQQEVPTSYLDSHCNSSTTWALQQEVPTSSPSSDSYDDSSPSGTFVCSSSVDLHGDMSTNGAFCQNFMVVQEGLDSHSNSSTTWALQQELLISSPSVESLSDLGTDRSLDLPIVVNSNIEVLEEQRQIIPLLSELNSFKPRGKIKKKEERVEEKICKGLVIKERWIKYYSSRHKILLVGEGDFSFSASLALAFGSATNMIATSLNSRGFLLQNYKNALFNIQNLGSRGCKVMHGVDAPEMADHLFFKGKKFNRIVFNFPLAGFFPNESRYSELCRNRNLVFLFLSNAKKMITRRGEVHISHKSNGFFKEWDLENLASSLSLQLIEEVHFNYTDYPGYHTKYGFGGDKNFNCNPSKTYKFGLKNFKK